jgi:hypothetical protein
MPGENATIKKITSLVFTFEGSPTIKNVSADKLNKKYSKVPKINRGNIFLKFLKAISTAA